MKRTKFRRLPRHRYQRTFSELSLGEVQLLLHGLHVIGEQNRVDLQLVRSYRVLCGQLATMLEVKAKIAGAETEKETP